MTSISFDALVPALVGLTVLFGLLWLVFWLVGLALRRVVGGQEHSDLQKGTWLLLWLRRLTLGLRYATSISSLVIAVLVMLYGVGVRGLPRLSWESMAEWVRGSGLPLLFILGSALVLIRAAGILTRSLPTLLVPANLSFVERMDRRKRVGMQGRLAFWIITVVVLAIAAVMTLQTVGVDVTPLLAGGAILSVALGFGAQNLVRDMIGGLFMILEDQLRVGDVATINGKTGEVEAIHMRVTLLRGLDGTVHIISNGDIRELSNLTKNYSYFVLDLGIAYKEDVDRVMDVLRDVGRELRADDRFSAKLMSALEVMGVNEFAASAVVIKLRIKTVPLEQWAVGRELRRRIKNRFDAEGIELPFPHLSVYVGEKSKPIPISVEDPSPRET